MELRCSLVLRCIEFAILTAVFLLVNGPTWICPVTFGVFFCQPNQHEIPRNHRVSNPDPNKHAGRSVQMENAEFVLR